MAQFNQGVNGAFSGKVGSVIGSNWRDIDYMRGLAKRTPKNPTAKQLAVRARFTLLSQFLLLVKNAVDRGFSRQYDGRSTAFNQAFRVNQAALIGTELDPQLDYTQIILSKGLTLTKPFGCKLGAGLDGSVKVSWQMFNGGLEDRSKDKITIVVYCPEKMEALVSMEEYLREDQVAEIEVPSNWSSTTVYAYLFATSEKGENSATAYAGGLPIL
ncbi:hypothetical protein B0I27_101247 [Arcticibacter pallidicorallinus]|uniref:Uncharacterized protein n=1 Tax=Arcticibacter pallidicorallinus TaxID=1259464 RepID=A0A2T0UBM5_9SPHI|nr:DUF6266 family protein [Arcticibacter pallidicorallinus]PRY55278.1 hypothetical protein B0I27_101247 [Arcticibacter pallidicorallinus]